MVTNKDTFIESKLSSGCWSEVTGSTRYLLLQKYTTLIEPPVRSDDIRFFIEIDCSRLIIFESENHYEVYQSKKIFLTGSTVGTVVDLSLIYDYIN